MDMLAEMRPKLKQDSIFLETRDGVFLRSDTTTFLLKGKSIYRWLSTLSPYMTGENTLGELCEGLEPYQQDTVVKLVNTLLQRGVLKNHIQEASSLLSEVLCKHFRAQIELIDHHVDHPTAHFKNFRESRMLLMGGGESLTALALSLLRNGLQNLYVLPDDAPGKYSVVLEREIAALKQDNIEASLSCPAPEDVRAYDIVVYCADECSLKDVAELQQRCLSQQQKFLPAVVFGGQALIGPFVQPQSGPCWMCAQMRISANARSEQSAAIWRSLALGAELSAWSTPLFTAQARMIGNGLGFELFKIFTECLPSETVAGLIFQDLETLEASQSRLIRHPLCPVCSHMDTELATQQLDQVVAGTHDKEVSLGDELLRHFNLLVDQRMGIFYQFVDDTMMQLPLKASRLKVNASASPLSAGFEITAFNTETLLEARLTAMTEAVSHYTRGLPDARMLVLYSMDEMEQRGKRTIAPALLTTWSGSSAVQDCSEWLPAQAILSQGLCYVPAGAVYPSTRLNQSGYFEKTSAGAVAHTNFADLLRAGIMSALAYDHIRELTSGHHMAVRLEQEALAQIDSSVSFLLKNAQHFKRPFELLEILTPSHLHLIFASTTDAAASEEQVSGFGWGLSAGEAANNALLHLVGGLQLLKYEEKLPDLRSNLIFPEFSLQASIVFAETTCSRIHEPATTMQNLQDYLRQSGRELLFVQTTTADLWDAELFMSGVVLLTHASV